MATSTLSSLLVRDSVLSTKRMEQAFQRQVIYGGALDTILLEMSIIKETQLLTYLALATGLPGADAKILDYFDPRAVQVCSREVAEEFQVAPLFLDNGSLRVFLTDPVDLNELEELATRLATPIQPYVVPEYRFHMLLDRLFGIPTPSRYASLAQKLGTHSSAGRGKPRAESATGKKKPRRDTVEFSVDAIKARVKEEEAAAQAVSATAPAPIAATAPAAVPQSKPAWGGADATESAPLEPKHASQEMARADTRDRIFSALVRGVRSRTTYAALLTVHGDDAFGRLAILGERSDAAAIGQVSAPLADLPAFQGVIESASPYIGPINANSDAARESLLSMGGLVPPAALLMPIAIRSRVVALVYSHRLNEALSPVDVSELLPLATDASLALSKLILRTKSQGYRKPETPALAVAAPSLAEAPSKKKKAAGLDDGWHAPAAGEPTPVAKPKARMPVIDPPPRAPQQVATLPPKAPPPASPPPPADAPAVSEPSQNAPPMEIAPDPTGRIVAEPKAAPTPTGPIGQVIDAIEKGAEPAASRAAEEALSRLEETLDELEKRFPGPLWVDRYRSGGRTLRASQHGPLLALCVRLGPRAAQVILECMRSNDREVRYYATLICGDVRSIDLLPGLVQRIFDPDYGVRQATLGALLGYGAKDLDRIFEPVRMALNEDEGRARYAAQALGDLRDVRAISALIRTLDRDNSTAEEARRALITLTKQDFGIKTKKWKSWWEKNHARPRIEWMLDSLAHSSEGVRLSAAEELKRLTGEYFGYHHDLPKREREKARKRWLKWWQTSGRLRFMRERGHDESSRTTAVLPTVQG